MDTSSIRFGSGSFPEMAGLGLIGGSVLGLIGHSTRWFGRGRGPFALSPLRGFINFFIFRIKQNIAGLEMLSRLLLSGYR